MHEKGYLTRLLVNLGQHRSSLVHRRQVGRRGGGSAAQYRKHHEHGRLAGWGDSKIAAEDAAGGAADEVAWASDTESRSPAEFAEEAQRKCLALVESPGDTAGLG